MTGRSCHTEPLVLGIDTSAYTTSVAVLTLDGKRVSDRRIVLSVPPGRRGLRQSEAVFQHVNNLPQVLEQAAGDAGGTFVAVGASVAPRSHPDSYMPVFRAGESAARSLAAWHGVPFVPVSHQDGHIWAGLWSARPAGTESAVASDDSLAEPSDAIAWADVDDVIVLHASGGTTELFRARRPHRHINGADGTTTRPGGAPERSSARWDVELLSASEDLYAGQFIDRSGVRLGLPFPAGAHLERLAAEGDPAVAPLPVAVRGERLSFSGPDTAAQRLVDARVPGEHVAASVQRCLADSLAMWAKNVLSSRPDLRVAAEGAESVSVLPRFLGVGGVMANRQLRQALAKALAEIGLDGSLFAAPRYSVDNALGVALATAMHYRSLNETAH